MLNLLCLMSCSNNTNYSNTRERSVECSKFILVQIIQITAIPENPHSLSHLTYQVQIIQITAIPENIC